MSGEQGSGDPVNFASDNAARQAAARAFRALALLPRADTVDARASMQAFCTIARANGMRAEQAIIILKEMWALETAFRSLLRTDERLALLGRAVTLCIDEFYADVDGGYTRPLRVRSEPAAPYEPPGSSIAT